MCVHFGWNLEKLDVIYAFLHEDLKEEVYREVQQGLNKKISMGSLQVKRGPIWSKAVTWSLVQSIY